MNRKDISNALKAKLATGNLASEAWPNINFDTSTLPRLEVVFSSRINDDESLNGDIDREVGTMNIVICTEKGLGEDAGLDIYDAIRLLMPKTLRLVILSGVVTITQAPSADVAAYPDDTAYRLPVALRYAATAT
jgi:hypothetical protein